MGLLTRPTCHIKVIHPQVFVSEFVDRKRVIKDEVIVLQVGANLDEGDVTPFKFPLKGATQCGKPVVSHYDTTNPYLRLYIKLMFFGLPLGNGGLPPHQYGNSSKMVGAKHGPSF